MKWKLLSSEYLSEHPYFTARKDVCEMPSGKIVDAYYVVELPVSVVVFPLTSEGEVVMVKQYRHAVSEILLELPGGFIDGGETKEDGAGRELMEETGYSFEEFVFLGKIYANPGLLNNLTYMYMAKGGKKVAEQEFDPHEELEVVLKPMDEVVALFKENKIPQSLHASCIFYALQKLGKI